MTRKTVYGTSLCVFLISVATTLASIIIPEWITWNTKISNPTNPIHYTYGLHSRCSSISGTCYPFPQWEDCQGSERTFCSLWRSAGFLMSASVALQLVAVVAFVIPLFGGKQKRQSGWRVLSVILALVILCQVTCMGIVAGVHDRDSRFYAGWKLGKSFILCTASWVVLLFIDVGLITSVFVLEEEGGYELIRDHVSQDS